MNNHVRGQSAEISFITLQGKLYQRTMIRTKAHLFKSAGKKYNCGVYVNFVHILLIRIEMLGKCGNGKL